MAEKTTAQLADETRLKVAEAELERASLDLEETRETNAMRRAQRSQRVQLSAQQQLGFAAYRKKLEQASKACSHRQGGEGPGGYRGKGPTALKIELHPDGFTKCIRCLVCPLQLFTPHPLDKSQKIRTGEKAADRDTRVAKYAAEEEVFNALLEKAEEDALSAEAAQPMDGGMRFTVRDPEGNIIQRRRPCDEYATSMRNVTAFG